MKSATSTNRARDCDAADAHDPEAGDVALNLKISRAGAAKPVDPVLGSGWEGRGLPAPHAPPETAAPDAGDGERGDPEARDSALSERMTGSAGDDPAAAELREAALVPIGLAPVDVVATPPRTGAAPAPGG